MEEKKRLLSAYPDVEEGLNKTPTEVRTPGRKLNGNSKLLGLPPVPISYGTLRQDEVVNGESSTSTVSSLAGESTTVSPSSAQVTPTEPTMRKKRKFVASWFTPSFVVIALVVLVGDTARGCLFPTLWPLVSSLGGDRIMQGYVVSAFSLGRLLASPYIGRLSELYGYRRVLVATSLILALGSLLYMASTEVWMVVASQMVMGVGSGTLGVTRAYVAEKTTRAKRTVLLAYLTAMQYAGFTVMPMVGGVMADIFENKEIKIVGSLRLDEYTAPASFLAVVSLLCVVLLCAVFEDSYKTHELPPPPSTRESINETEETHHTSGILGWCNLSRHDVVIVGGILLNISTKGVIALYETLGIQFATSHFNLTAPDAGFLFASFGLVGVMSLMCMKRLCAIWNDVELILGGMVLMMACNLILIGPEKFPIWRLYLAIFFMYSLGYPIGHTAVMGMFSKVLGKRPQGYLMGIFGSAGSLARVIFPIVGGHIAEDLGNNTLFGFATSVLFVSGLVLFAGREEVLHLSEN